MSSSLAPITCKVYRRIQSVEGYNLPIQEVDTFITDYQRFLDDCVKYSLRSSELDCEPDCNLQFGLFRGEMPLLHGIVEANRIEWKSV